MVLHIPVEIWRKLQLYTKLSAPNEVTGIGTIVALDAENLKVTEVFLPRQTTSLAECQFKEGELNEIIYDLLEHDPERAGQLRFRWHSHGSSGVFWSQKDEKDIESWEAPWVVNLVMNTRSEFLIRFDYFEPLRIRNYQMQLQVDYPDDSELRMACAEELSEKLSVLNPSSRFFGKEL